MSKHIPLLAALLVCSSSWAQTPQTVSDAIQKLRDASSYTWTVTTELSGAPFKVAPITGITDMNGLVVLQSEDGKKFAVAKGTARVLKTRSGWKAATELGSVKDATDHDLLTAQRPPDELAALTTKWSDVKAAGDGSFTGMLNAATAKAYLASSMPGGAPGGRTPEIQTASGKFQLWLKDGLPQKYTLIINARISLPFGTKDVTRLSTTEVKEVGTTTLEVPTEARQALEK